VEFAGHFEILESGTGQGCGTLGFRLAQPLSPWACCHLRGARGARARTLAPISSNPTFRN